MIYNALIFYGIKMKIVMAGISELMSLSDGTHASTSKAVAASLDVYVRSMDGYLQYEPGDAYLFIGQRILGADIDRPIGEVSLEELGPAAIAKVQAQLTANGYTDAPRLHLICDHSN